MTSVRQISLHRFLCVLNRYCARTMKYSGAYTVYYITVLYCTVVLQYTLWYVLCVLQYRFFGIILYSTVVNTVHNTLLYSALLYSIVQETRIRYKGKRIFKGDNFFQAGDSGGVENASGSFSRRLCRSILFGLRCS